MAPTNTKTFREIKVDTSKVEYDPAKKRMRMRTELGYNLVFEMEPHVSVNPYDPFGQNGTPEFQTNIMLRPISVEKGENPMTQPQISEMIKNRNVIPSELNYETFSLGFVYANAQNPNNHKWMFEYRRRQQIFWAQHFLGVNLKKIPITTISWFDGIYHGRFLIQRGDVLKVTEESPGHVLLWGKNQNVVNPVSDFSKIVPKGIVKLRLRFNVREDYWYADLLKEGQVISDLKPLKMRHIVAENIDFDGVADFNFQKPKVFYSAKVNELADVKLMAETLMLTGKGEPAKEPEPEEEK